MSEDTGLGVETDLEEGVGGGEKGLSPDKEKEGLARDWWTLSQRDREFVVMHRWWGTITDAQKAMGVGSTWYANRRKDRPELKRIVDSPLVRGIFLYELMMGGAALMAGRTLQDLAGGPVEEVGAAKIRLEAAKFVVAEGKRVMEMGGATSPSEGEGEEKPPNDFGQYDLYRGLQLPNREGGGDNRKAKIIPLGNSGEGG